jgi:ribose transport system ATP-binding protein
MTSEQSILSVEDITKSFPGVMALRGVSFAVLPGEVHGLVGENGAGKSTLMRILAGVYQPDAGTISVRGAPTHLDSPEQAHRLGIGMVYQDTRLAGDLDIVQNIGLGHEETKLGLIDRGDMQRRALASLASLGIEIDPHRPVRELSLAERQSVEIARALWLDPAVLILDEPTTGLDPTEVSRLFTILRNLRAQGKAIVFISHRLPEVLTITDRVTVMKDGAIVGTVDTATTTEDTLVRMMVGREMSTAFPPKAQEAPRPCLEVTNLRSHAIHGVTFTIGGGEIVGLGGIQGNGQRAIARALAGLEPAEGTIQFDGKTIRLASPRGAVARGIVYLSSDRRGESMFLPLSVRENMSAPHLAELTQLGVVSSQKENSVVQGVIDQLRIQTPSAEQTVEFLSGGNQQKVVVGRWLISKPRVYIFDEPTQGVDVGTKLELYRIIRQLAAEGAAVLVLSTDTLELIGLCDRILVVADGRIVDTVTAAEATEERVVGSAVTAQRVGAGDGNTAAQVEAAPKPAKGYNWFLQRYGSAFLVFGLLLLMALYTQTQSEYFLRPRNLSNLAIQVTPLAIVAVGMMATILLGGIDLSVGPTMSLVTAIASFLIIPGGSPGALAFGVAVCLAAGLGVGLANGIMIRYLKIPDLIATLASYTMVFGIALIVRPAPGGTVDAGFMDVVTAQAGRVPLAFLLTLAIYIVGEAVLLRGKIGTALYATGSNREAALVAGIPVERVRFFVYIFSGLMAAIAGLILAARIGSGDPQSGTGFTLAAVTAVVVGGTSIFGGRGTLVGTLAGSILVILIQNALNQLRVSAYYQYIWIGVLTLLAVVIYSFREHGSDWERLRMMFRR